jgi:DNA-binding FadR family transcriptional regulator
LPDSLQNNSKEHREILDALEKGAYEDAKQISRHHITKRLKGASKTTL